jgi:hypothetical protein
MTQGIGIKIKLIIRIFGMAKYVFLDRSGEIRIRKDGSEGIRFKIS